LVRLHHHRLNLVRLRRLLLLCLPHWLRYTHHHQHHQNSSRSFVTQILVHLQWLA
jgi:hypothetical protein